MNSIKAKTVRKWYQVHKWTSLVCTAFLLMSCVTGLPLIFEDEISGLIEHHVVASDAPQGAQDASLDRMLATTQAHFPAMKPFAVAWDEDEPRVFVTMSPSLNPEPADVRSLIFDRHTGQILEETRDKPNFLSFVLDLHREMYVGLFGELLMGFMALLFAISLASGALVYGPFMRRLEFGAIRRGKSARLRWLDLHNLLGIVTLSWALMVGATGVMNALSTPLFGLWRAQIVPELLNPYHGKPLPQRLAPVEAVIEKTRETLPGNTITSLVFPNATLTSPRHYLIWTKGKEPLTSRLFTPVLFDAETGQLTAAKGLPWYLRTLEISRPLHFGDYGGTPLKIIWALFDVVLIVVLVSGLYLWLSRRRAPVEDELDRLVALEMTMPEIQLEER
jgi:uncharacterized iron-regulated membrane protein